MSHTLIPPPVPPTTAAAANTMIKHTSSQASSVKPSKAEPSRTKLSKQVSKQVSKHTSKQTSNTAHTHTHTSKQANKQASKQTSTQASKQASRQAITQSLKHYHHHNHKHRKHIHNHYHCQRCNHSSIHTHDHHHDHQRCKHIHNHYHAEAPKLCVLTCTPEGYIKVTGNSALKMSQAYPEQFGSAVTKLYADNEKTIKLQYQMLLKQVVIANISTFPNRGSCFLCTPAIPPPPHTHTASPSSSLFPLASQFPIHTRSTHSDSHHIPPTIDSHKRKQHNHIANAGNTNSNTKRSEAMSSRAMHRAAKHSDEQQSKCRPHKFETFSQVWNSCITFAGCLLARPPARHIPLHHSGGANRSCYTAGARGFVDGRQTRGRHC